MGASDQSQGPTNKPLLFVQCTALPKKLGFRAYFVTPKFSSLSYGLDILHIYKLQ
jgi:hypothetical protein